MQLECTNLVELLNGFELTSSKDIILSKGGKGIGTTKDGYKWLREGIFEIPKCKMEIGKY